MDLPEKKKPRNGEGAVRGEERELKEIVEC